MGSGIPPVAVLAIDAGNSKTDLWLVADDGEVLARARGGPFHPHLVGATAAVAGLVDLVDQVRRTAGIQQDDGPLALHISACLANADLPAEDAALVAALEAWGWGETCAVHNDTFALLRAGLDVPRGVAVVCGAGINAAGRLEDGTTVRFPAVGQVSGDWGGGVNLWREAMWWAARAEDGRGPRTALQVALPGHFGLQTMDELITAVHLSTLTSGECMELTPLLFDIAEAGDAVAGAIVRRQAEEVVALAVAAMRRLGVIDQEMDVVLGGGVLTAGRPQLMGAIDELLSEAAPRARVRVVTTPPVVGAALLGLDELGAHTTAKDRLRAATVEVA